MINQEWTIQSRADRCATTGVPFQDGDYFYTLLFDEGAGLRREDLSETAWKERNDNRQPFSFWRSKFEAPPPAAPETVTKHTAEDLLRRYMEESSPQHAAARYLLAAMLERKKLLKEVEAKRAEGGALTRIYEHTKTGEVFVVPDPQLRLDQIEQVRAEVSALARTWIAECLVLQKPSATRSTTPIANFRAPQSPTLGKFERCAIWGFRGKVRP